MIQAATDRLDDKLKIPLLMYYTAEISVDEVSLALRIPQGTVKSRLFKARKAMKKILEVESL
jgi:RNA polymerase sigma-70 factor (ECF subfamily)